MKRIVFQFEYLIKMALFIRWGVNIAEWNVSKEEFDKLLDSVEPEEKTRISKYLKESDRKV